MPVVLPPIFPASCKCAVHANPPISCRGFLQSRSHTHETEISSIGRES